MAAFNVDKYSERRPIIFEEKVMATKTKVPEPDKAKQTASPKTLNGFKQVLDRQKKVKIKLWKNPEEKDPLPEIVCINGCRYQIEKGVEVDVPELVAEVLKQSGKI